ncbi:MAG: ATPase V [Paludibacteraceae bacterium]|nr:ATPase V [Paludibacteraceae bacterium]
MITQMKKYTFLVFHKEYDAFLETLREAGVMHIREKAGGMADDPELQEALQKADGLRRLIKQGAPDQLLQEKAEVEQKIAATEKEAERMQIFGNFKPETLAKLKEAGYALYLYSVSKSQFVAEWGIIVGEVGGKVYFVSMEALSEELPVTEVTLNGHNAAQLGQDIEALRGLLTAANARIEAWALANLDNLKAELKATEQTIDWKRVQLNTTALAEDSLMLIEGFCPADTVENLNAKLETLNSVYYEVEDPTDEDPTPIKLKNNKFFQMFECLTGMYGWPNYNEFDPTPILGPFFLLFFAFCMGDSGYGVLLTVIGILIAKGKLKIEMFDGLGPIITALGIGTTVIGFFLGSFFGMNLAEQLPALSNIFLNGKFMDTTFDFQMVLALGIGIFHICLAMVVKAICYTKQSGFVNNLGTWGWTLLVVGGVLVMSIGLLMALPMETIKWILIVLGGISAIGIYILNDVHRNPLINVGSGLWDTYNMVTGLMGDVLSYVRLYALGLAGGMLGAAFNTLGLMVRGEDPNIGTWIGFLLIVLVGHGLNLALSALGAFVHPLRLSFVEYFKNVGYEGKGKKYEPFKK